MSTEGLSGDVWPWHPKPLPDELLSSWLMRIIRDYGVKPHFFCKREWPGVQIWTRDVDKLAPEVVLEGLSKKTGTPYARVYEATLRAYEGRAFAHWNPNGNTRWILALGIYHRLHRLPGLQFCPLCLAEDEKPYFRRLWRMGFAVVCTKHRIRLLECCPNCGEPVNFHRVAGPLVPLTVCHQCGRDLRQAPAFGECDDRRVSFQSKIEQSLASRVVNLASTLTVPTYEYLDVVRQLISILMRPIRKRDLGVRLSQVLDRSAPPPAEVWPVTIERLGNWVRYEVFALVEPLLRQWPTSFYEMCRDARIWKTDLEKDATGMPVWFLQVTSNLLGQHSVRG